MSPWTKSKAAEGGLGWGGAKPQGVWGAAVTNGVQGRIPGKGSGGRNLPLAEEIFK